MGAPIRNEKGIVLIIAILFLFVLSILTLILHKSSLTEIASSSSYRKSQQSFFAAERGVQKGLSWLAGLSAAPENSVGMPAWFYPNPVNDPPVFSTFSSVGGARYSYAIEHLKDGTPANAGANSAKIGGSTSSGPKVHFYRITGKGTDSAGGNVKKVQVVTTADF